MISDVVHAWPAREGLAWAAIPPVLVALPFLLPLVGGPSANVWQLLASWSCVALLLASSELAWPARRLLLGLGLSAAAIALSTSTEWTAQLSACVGLGVVGAAAAVGAGLARGNASAQRGLAWGLLGAGLISAVLGLLQYYQLAAPLVPWTTTPELGQAYGNLRQRNQFATLISMALIAGLWLYARCPAPARRRRSAPASAALLLLLLAAAASTSRTGLVQWLLVVGVAAWIAWQERRRGRRHQWQDPDPRPTRPTAALRLPHPLLLLALVPAYFAASWLLPSLAGGTAESMLGRLRDGAPEGRGRGLLWHNVIELIAQHPWRGWGWGELAFAHYSHLYAGPRFVEILDNAHNLPLHLAVTLGVPAALLLVAGLAWMVLAARPWRERDSTRLMAWGMLGVIGLHSLLEYPLWYGPFQLALGLCLGLLWPAPARRAVASSGPKQPTTASLVAPALVALALLSLVGYAGWDYHRVSQLYLPRDERSTAYRNDTSAKLQSSWLYASTVQFADLTLMSVTRDNAAEVHALAERALHFSPEPRVIVKLIESAQSMGLNDEALAQALRFKRAFPQDYARWVAGAPLPP